MKSQTIYRNNKRRFGGFLTVEIMLAFSLMVIFVISTFTLTSSMMALRVWSVNELDRLEKLTHDFNSGIYDTQVDYGNDTKILSNSLFDIAKSDFVEAYGRNNCNSRISFDKDKISYFNTGINTGSSNPSTDLEVRNGIIYLTTDSSTSSVPDLYILDANNPADIKITSSLNTGPGISAIEVAGAYLYLAQASTVNQLQIIDIHDRGDPKLISQLKLNLPTPTTTTPFATSIFYSKGFVYLGTAKWAGSEFSIIDVSSVSSPSIVGTFETNTQINDIYVRGDIAYLATSDEKQMRMLDVSNKSNPVLINSFSSNGWQTQEGKILEYFESKLGLGRTVGGFNVIANHEVFIFSSTSKSSSTKDLSIFISKDVPGGVYGILKRPNYIFLLTHFLNKEFQVFDGDFNSKILDFPLNSSPVKMACDANTIYFATGDTKGVSVLKIF